MDKEYKATSLEIPELSELLTNVLRDEDTPTWETIARNTGVVTWTDLLVQTGVIEKKSEHKVYIVTSQKPLYEKLEKLLGENDK